MIIAERQGYSAEQMSMSAVCAIAEAFSYGHREPSATPLGQLAANPPPLRPQGWKE